VTRIEGRPGLYVEWNRADGTPGRKKVEGDESKASSVLFELEECAARERAILRFAEEPTPPGANSEVIEVLTVRKLILQGPDGKPRSVLDTGPGDEVSLGLLDGAGVARMVLRVDDRQGVIDLLDAVLGRGQIAAGRVKLAIGVGAAGAVTFATEDAPANPAPPPSEPAPPEA
jgi:hypothetical protein